MTGALLNLMVRVTRAGVWVSGVALIGVSLMVTIEVLLRKVFLVGLSVATELSAYTLAVGTAWAYGYALLERSHVRVDALIHLLPRRHVVWIDLLALVAITWLAGMLVWHGSVVFGMSLERGARAMTPLETPLWIPQGLWVVGLLIFFVTCLVVLARTVRLLAEGQTEAVSHLIGTLSREEEAESEAAEAGARRTSIEKRQ